MSANDPLVAVLAILNSVKLFQNFRSSDSNPNLGHWSVILKLYMEVVRI